MKKILMALCLTAVTSWGWADSAFEAAHSRDAQGRFIEKDTKEAVLSGGALLSVVTTEPTRPVEFDVVSHRDASGKLTKRASLLGGSSSDSVNTVLTVGPLDFNVPLMNGRATYLFDFNSFENLVGVESPFITAWNKFEGTVGVATTLSGKGVPFIGGNVLLRNVFDKIVMLPEDFSFGAFGSYDWNTNKPMYGIKSSLRIWAL